MPYIYSTLTASQKYTTYKKSNNDMAVIDKQIVINGGAGISDKFLRTPNGAVTNVTEEELDLLKTNKSFQRHMERGFVTVDDKLHDVDNVVADMTTRDGSAPLVDGDFAPDMQPQTNGEQPKPAPTAPHASTTRANQSHTAQRRR